MARHPETTEHNYLAKVAAYVAKHGDKLTPERVAYVTVQHDEWCNAVRNKKNKLCNCRPELVTFDD